MNRVATTFAKLAGLLKTLKSVLANPRAVYLDPPSIVGYFAAYNLAASVLREDLPALFGDIPERQPVNSGTQDHQGRGFVYRGQLDQLVLDIEYIFEVRAHSELQPPQVASGAEVRVFISHGGAPDWGEVQAYVERDLNVPTLELAQQPSRGRTILQKLIEESKRCSYAVIVMTGEDKTEEGQLRARENVMHEIGYFQGKFGPDRICLLHEEGVNVPSNIQGVVYIPFPPGLVSATFGVLAREIRAAFPADS